MPSLKDLKNRIKTVKNTQKITKAMKMVAAAKLRRAREAAENSRPYSENMERLVNALAASNQQPATGNILSGTGKDNLHLLIIATSDRGLCGGFNSTLVRAARRRIRSLRNDGKEVKLLFIGRKGYEQLHSEFSSLIIGKLDVLKKKMSFADAEIVASEVLALFERGEFDIATIIYNKFKSAITQEITWQQLVPLAVADMAADDSSKSQNNAPDNIFSYKYEPTEAEILSTLLPKNLAVQIYKALLENSASEQGARMTAMDNATRNAGEMIKKLNLKYNRTRQASITKELIEIISGAEAV